MLCLGVIILYIFDRFNRFSLLADLFLRCYAEEKKQLFFLEFVSYEMIAYINVLASPMKFRIFNKLDSWSSYPRKDSL